MPYLWKAKSDVACLAGLLAMSALPALPVRGDVIFFDNGDGEFDWNATCFVPCPPDSGTYLDITQPSSQSGESSPWAFRKFFEYADGTPHWSTKGLGNAIAADDEPTLLLGDHGVVEEFYFARELGPGDVVDGNLNMEASAFLSVYNPGIPPGIPEVYEIIDTPAYIGVSFGKGSQLHYGWILIDTGFQPLQWAYETEPDTPITIEKIVIDPCPGNFNGNGTVEIDDMLSLLGAWGPCLDCPQDLDGDGIVGITDFLTLLANWGPCPLN